MTIGSPSSHSALMSSFVMLMAPTLPRAPHAPNLGVGMRPGRAPTIAAMVGTLVLLRHGESDWNQQEPVHRLGRRRPDREGRGRGAPRRRAARRARPAARRRAHVAAAAGDPHRRAGAGRRRPDVDPGAPLVAAERAPLRRAAGQGQGADAGRVRRGAVHALAPLLRHAAAAAARATTSTRSSTTPATPALPPEVRPRTECLADVVDAHAAVLVRRHRPRPAGRLDGARRRPRQQPAGADQAPRRDDRGGRRRPQRADRHPAALRPRRRPAADARSAARTSTRRPPRPRSRRSRTRASAEPSAAAAS